MDHNDRHSAIEKALKVLMLFEGDNPELGTMEISYQLGFHKATVSRIVWKLVQYGFLRQNAHSKKFQLGPTVRRLGQSATRTFDGQRLLDAARPAIDEVRNRLQESSTLEILTDNGVSLAYLAEGPGPVSIKGTVGELRPMHASAGAKAILAFSPEAFRQRVLSARLTSLTPNTISRPEQLIRELDAIREKGYAVDREEVHLGIQAVAVPVFDPRNGEPVAAVAAAGLARAAFWENDTPIVTVLKAAAEAISRDLAPL